MAVLLLQAAFVNESILRFLCGGDTAMAVPLSQFCLTAMILIE